MPETYTITIRNKSADQTAFVLFTEPPVVNPNDNTTIYTNVFQLSEPANNDGHGTAIFKVEKKTLAVCLTSKKALGAGTNVTTSDWQEVNIGTYEQQADIINVTYDTAKKAGDLQPAVKATEANKPAGGFVMTTAPATWTYPTSNYFSIGVGAMDGDDVRPLSIFNARPNKTYNIFPVVTYYVAPAGDYEAGDIIDVKTVPASKPIQFKNGITSYILEYAADNAFHVVASS
ncbi:hypothetical protein TWF481_012072 [Arthrobotrys musiformis]|uniref:Uncharacterized protein n=1 Tax=Arthrobotrys musiformis TaxID=47236 RepID=A0AAV9VW56_9PEZI